MFAGQHVAALGERVVELIVEILLPEFKIAIPGTALICQKEIL